MNLTLRFVFLLGVLLLGSGCQSESHDHSADDHSDVDSGGHADSPASFDEALELVQSMKTEICEAFKNETPDDAHGQLHEIGHLLEDLPTLAVKGKELSPEEISQVEQAVEALYDGFGKLDSSLHHKGEEVDVGEVDELLADALDRLKAVANSSSDD